MVISKARTMSVSEFKSQLGTITREIGDQPIIVENHGKPVLMVFSIDEGEALVEAIERKRRQEILRKFEAIQIWNDEHNANLTDEQLMALAVKAAREVRETVQSRFEAGEIS